MKKSASQVIRSLESRIARLEKQSTHKQSGSKDLKEFIEFCKKYNLKKMGDVVSLYALDDGESGGKDDIWTVTFNPYCQKGIVEVSRKSAYVLNREGEKILKYKKMANNMGKSARLEKEAKKNVSFFNFVFDLSKGLGVQEIEVTKSLLKWAWNHRNKGFGLRDYAPDAPIYYCTFTYRKIEVSDTGSIKVDVEITNPLGETLKDTIFGFINMSGKVQFSSKKIARLEKSAYKYNPNDIFEVVKVSGVVRIYLGGKHSKKSNVQDMMDEFYFRLSDAFLVENYLPQDEDLLGVVENIARQSKVIEILTRVRNGDIAVQVNPHNISKFLKTITRTLPKMEDQLESWDLDYILTWESYECDKCVQEAIDKVLKKFAPNTKIDPRTYRLASTRKLEKQSYRVRPRTEAQMESYDSEWGRKHHYRVFDTERDVERYIKTEFGLKGFEFERVPNKNYGRYFINLKQVRKAIRWDKMIQVHSLEFDKYWNVEKDAKWLRPSRLRKED